MLGIYLLPRKPMWMVLIVDVGMNERGRMFLLWKGSLTDAQQDSLALHTGVYFSIVFVSFRKSEWDCMKKPFFSYILGKEWLKRKEKGQFLVHDGSKMPVMSRTAWSAFLRSQKKER